MSILGAMVFVAMPAVLYRMSVYSLPMAWFASPGVLYLLAKHNEGDVAMLSA